MEKQKVKEEEKLKEVMESLKEETSGLQQDKEVSLIDWFYLFILNMDIILHSFSFRWYTFSLVSVKSHFAVFRSFLAFLLYFLQTKEKDLLELSKAVNETRSRVDLAQSELEIYLSRHNTALTQLNTAKQTLETTSNTLRERRAAIKDLEVKIPQKEQELKKVNISNLCWVHCTPRCTHSIVPAWLSVCLLFLNCPYFSLQDEGELEQLMKLDNATREVVREMRQKVDEAKSSLSSNRSRGKVLDALMQQKKSGRISGILGRLVNKMLRYRDANYFMVILLWCANTFL